MEWIKLKDSLPEEGERVLCIAESGYMAIGFNLHNKMLRDTGCEEFNKVGYTLTHWQTLPKAPK